MTAPDRSTTHVVTDLFRLFRRRWPQAAAVLFVLGAMTAAIGVRALPSEPQRRPATEAAAPPALLVGDHRTVTLVSLGGSRTDALLSRVADDVGPAVTAVEGFWGTDWAHEILVIATGSAADFTAQAGAGTPLQRPDTAAVAVADRFDTSQRTAAGQRVVLAPGAAAMSAPALRIVLAHELFHYAARADTAVDAPRWLTEGVADYVARPVPGRNLRATVATAAALPSDDEFAGDAAALSAAYDRAWLFARFVAERHGQAVLRELYLRACGAGHADAQTALRSVLGGGPRDVLAQWHAWASEADHR